MQTSVNPDNLRGNPGRWGTIRSNTGVRPGLAALPVRSAVANDL